MKYALTKTAKSESGREQTPARKKSLRQLLVRHHVGHCEKVSDFRLSNRGLTVQIDIAGSATLRVPQPASYHGLSKSS